MLGLKNLSELQTGIILINKHNSDKNQMEVREGYRHKLIKHWPLNRTEFSSSTIPTQNTYLPGNTLISVLNNWTGHILTSEVDPTKMGRWSYISLRGKKEKSSVCTVCAECPRIPYPTSKSICTVVQYTKQRR